MFVRACLCVAGATLAVIAACSTTSLPPHVPPSVAPPLACPAPSGAAVLQFHGDRGHAGWDDAEPTLTPDVIAPSSFGELWESPQLAAAVIGGTAYAPHLYASPLIVDGVQIGAGPYAGATRSVVFAATSNGDVYAINAAGTNCDGQVVPYGVILWRAHLADPTVQVGLDGDIPLGIMSTPIIDPTSTPPVLYAVATDGPRTWQAFALDLGTGAVRPGWPVRIDNAAVQTILPGAPPLTRDATRQRGALALSPDAARLYVTFGALGWIMALDTGAARLVEAFPGGPQTAPEQAGMWGPGGPAIDLGTGVVYEPTGNSPASVEGMPGFWGETVLAFEPTSLQLRGTYTPFNYCKLDVADADFGGSSPLLLDLDPSVTSTPHLLAVGSKQGNVYLLDRDHLPGRTDNRPPCSQDASSDGSLLPPEAQPQFGTRGPLSVFGPYSETLANLDYAKMRTTPALFRDATGATFLFVSGQSKAAPDSVVSVPPSLARLRVVSSPGAPAYLAIDAVDHQLAFVNAGSPVVTSDHGAHPVVWILDENVPRTAGIVAPQTPRPVLYAVDGVSMKLLWKSGPADLLVGGKYSTPAVAHGTVIVGTDRIEAFGPKPPDGAP